MRIVAGCEAIVARSSEIVVTQYLAVSAEPAVVPESGRSEEEHGESGGALLLGRQLQSMREVDDVPTDPMGLSLGMRRWRNSELGLSCIKACFLHTTGFLSS